MQDALAKKDARTAASIAAALEKQQERISALLETNPGNQALDDAFCALSQAIAMLDDAIAPQDDR